MTITLDLLRARVARVIGWALWVHVPLVLGFALLAGVAPLVPVLVTLALTAVVEGFAVRRPGQSSSHVLMAIVYAAQVAILVGLMRDHPWQADMHMYFFAGLAVLGALCSWSAILAYVGFVAVHHLALNFLATEFVFPGQSELGRVLLHAVILVVEGAAMGALTFVLARIFAGQATVLAAAQQARDDAQRHLAEHSASQATQARFVTQLVERITDLANGDYGRDLPPNAFPPEYEGVRNSLNLLSRRLAGAVSTVGRALRGVQDSGASLASTGQALGDSSQDQVALLERARQAFGQIGQDMVATTGLASEADLAMQENRGEVERGTELLSEVVAAMGLIEQSTGQIRQIVEVMDNIAFQTNLLALNAGVEAARAGDSGRGFAVVAQEVRALAQRAAESAREIRGLIDQGQGNVAQGTRKVSMTTQALESLITSASRAAGFVSQITERIHGQSKELRSLEEEVNSLDAQARHNSALADKIAAAGQELRRHSGELSRGIGDLEGNKDTLGRAA